MSAPSAGRTADDTAERDALAVVHVQVDPEEGLVPVGVGVGQAADVEDRGAHGSRPV